jgi:zinc protease
MLPLGVAAAELPTPVHEFTLDNGLRVVVRPDNRAPVVVSQVWYRVGSSYEHNGITGISHMLEHMMFKGTESIGPGELSRIVAAEGGEDNAFTSRDYTAYYQNLASDRLEVSFRLEADRMANLALSAREFQPEREVVVEERKLRTEDRPESLTYEAFMAAAFKTSPYQYPVIGWMADIESYELADLQAWYERWYSPGNATLVVVGDVDPEAVHALAKKHFGPLPAREVHPPKPRPEVVQRGERRITVKVPAKLPNLVFGYKVPSLLTSSESWEPYALQVLAALLDADDSSRLARNLVRGQEIATSAEADYSPYARLTTLLVLSGTPAPGATVEQLEQGLLAEVERLKTELVGERELTKIKNQVVANDVFQRDSVSAQAIRLGVLETLGLGWRVGEEYVQRIRAVTPEQVQAVARKYLHEDSRTVAILEPQPLPAETPPRTAALEGSRHAP